MKFPSYILNNPTVEKPSLTSANLPSATLQEYTDAQKKNYMAALHYAEAHILNRPIQTWTKESLIADLEKLNEILGNTLYSHPFSVTTGISQSGFRTLEAYATRQIPVSTINATFNMECPHDVASLLIFKGISDGPVFDPYASAANFIKWCVKCFPFNGIKLEKLDENMRIVIESYVERTRCSYQDWLRKHFNGKTIVEWRKDFFSKEQNKHLLPIGLINYAKRQALPGLFTKDEIAASQQVLKVFPSPETIPQLMDDMAARIIKMIQDRRDPIEIANVFHAECAHNIHGFGNANGRTIRLMANIMLMNYGYPAIQYEGALKDGYYRAIEAYDEDPKLFDEFIRSQIPDHIKMMKEDPRTQPLDKMANSLCIAASKGDLNKILALLKSEQSLVYLAPLDARGNTALHYACQNKQWEAAALLIGAGARIDKANQAGKDALQLIKDNPERVSQLREVFWQQKLERMQPLLTVFFQSLDLKNKLRTELASANLLKVGLN